ncbi:MAG: peptidase inhibitor family I36 protein [Knoellia sp.]
MLASVAVGAALVAVSAPSASAATGYARCPDGRMCVFSDPNGTGAMAVFEVGDWDLGDGVGPQGMNNNIESFWNRTSYSWDFWKGANGSGEWLVVGPSSRANFINGWQNTVTSLHYY